VELHPDRDVSQAGFQRLQQAAVGQHRRVDALHQGPEVPEELAGLGLQLGKGRLHH
jgi:hypothetical protein